MLKLQKSFFILASIVSSAFTSACMQQKASNGYMHGVISGSKVKVVVEYAKHPQSTWLQITIPDGEVFRGRVIHSKRTASIHVGNKSGLSSLGKTNGIPVYGNIGTSQKKSEKISNQMSGKLFSETGVLMECSFQYADALGDPKYGGFGVCIAQDMKIDIAW